MERPSALFVVRRERFLIQGCPLPGDLRDGVKDLRRKMGNQVNELLGDAGANVLTQNYGNGNGSWTQAELQSWLDANVSSTSQKAVLWELTNSGWKNNPYR